MKIYFRQILSFAQVWPIKLKKELKHATGIPKRRLRVLVLQIQHKTLQQGPVDGGLGFRSMCIKMMLATGRPRRRSGLLELSKHSPFPQWSIRWIWSASRFCYQLHINCHTRIIFLREVWIKLFLWLLNNCLFILFCIDQLVNLCKSIKCRFPTNRGNYRLNVQRKCIKSWTT